MKRKDNENWNETKT